MSLSQLPSATPHGGQRGARTSSPSLPSTFGKHLRGQPEQRPLSVKILRGKRRLQSPASRLSSVVSSVLHAAESPDLRGTA